MRCTRPLLSSLLFLTVFSPALANGPTKVANSDAITANRLLAHLQLVASDEMEGRDTPSRGLNTTAKYIQAQLMLWGVKPMGDDGTYFQKIGLKAPIVNAEKTTAKVAGSTLKYGDQFLASATPGSADGQLVFMPNAWEKPGDASSPYAKVDVKGKILITVRSFRAPGVSRQDSRQYESPVTAGAKHGAKGIIYFWQGDNWDSAVANSTKGGSPRPPRPELGTVPFPSISMKPEAMSTLFAGEAVTVEDIKKGLEDGKWGAPFALAATKTASFTVVADDNTVWTQNVVGMIEGSDPKLKSEFVAIGAHYDHLGMRQGGSGDIIYNGADDDGSGTVSVLEIAHAFAEGPKPKRSLIFVWHCGEEKGLWGSGYFTEHPPVPITSIVAQLNIDMIGRSRKDGDTNPANKMLGGPNAIYLVGTTRMSSELGAEAKSVNSKLYNLTYDFTYDDINNPEQIFFRSDHFNYALRGIPILFWFDGVHQDYHKVSDEVPTIDFTKMEKVARTVYATALSVGNRKDRPKVDMPLPPEFQRQG